jgi:hypothetical protein
MTEKKRRRQGARGPPTVAGTKADEAEAVATVAIAAQPASSVRRHRRSAVRSSPVPNEDAPRRRRPIVGSKKDVGPTGPDEK